MGKKGARAEQNYPKLPFLLSADEIIIHLETRLDSGLSSAQVQQYQQKYGPNRLEGDGGVSWYAILGKQISNAMILVLVLAMALSYGVEDFVEGAVITAVIVLNVVIGFYQEFQAEKKMDALRSLSSPSAAVIRDGNEMTVPSAEVVPGDIVSIKTGDTVPADLRLFEVMNLECDEAILTGEALPVAKEVEFEAKHGTAKEDLGLGDRLNIAYSSSTVTKGRGRGVVVYTGMSTAIGGIAASMQGKRRKPNRSMSRKKYGPMQPVKGGALRVYDGVRKFLGLTGGTPLQIKLSKLAYVLFGCAILLAIIVFGVNRFNVTNEVAIYAISTGIAIIPESLIAVLTITMVVGMTQMRKRKVVIRQLSALEALGGVTNICSDKTGTLTQGKMVTRKAFIPGVGIYSVENSNNASDPTEGTITLGKAPKSRQEVEAERLAREEAFDRKRSTAGISFDLPSEKVVQKDAEKASVEQDNNAVRPNLDVTPELQAFLESAALCNLATVRKVTEDGQEKWKTAGDPTEIALQVFSHRFNHGKKTLEEENGWTQKMEYPFDSSIKRMSVVYTKAGEGHSIIFTKGAVERIIDLCTAVGVGENEQAMTASVKEGILEQMTFLAEQGLRVLAIARKFTTMEIAEHSDVDRSLVEKDLCLLGLAGLYDPPRLETKTAVQACTTAGITVSMLTGDHPSTATAIAKEVGIIPRNMGSLPADVAAAIVKTATEFDRMSDSEIDALPTLPLVVARCAPETKVRMIEALHRRNKFAAMTGDGVNDSPSLKLADVGIAMGLNGSDVAKSASDIVLTDDNFASIVNAVEEGRRMFDNIQRFVLHLLTSNVGEVILLICGLGFQDDTGFSVFPLSPLQILWINMLTSSFPAFGLGREKASPDVMERPPHDNKKGVFTWELITDMLVYGTIQGTCCLMTFVFIVYGPGPDGLGRDCNRKYNDTCDVVFRARAAVFAELTWLILISAWEFKALRRSMFRINPHDPRTFPFFQDIWENQFLFWSVVIGALSVFPAVYIPGLNTSVFKHKGISWEWAPAIVCVFVFVSGMEAWKYVKRAARWFEEEETEGMKVRRHAHGHAASAALSLRQGFFTMTRSFTRSKSEEKQRTMATTRRELSDWNTSGRPRVLPKVREDV
ncbi:potassium/sodium efflux P-type ATPase, fungal-type [Cladophialophora bantiana CBS 173.52]|uniref:P-type Na(+) transporter n=1 Tax=Cladophialophora bantiana (strain ATCC 10958 / CBS 173.52 / CDC B-1940 / NIH 8579) TaxID=1442370 RepID=A0A0D2F5D2_CLAB1|nr:potassium/sodium efflux P-type ATPase, fungal-type [Cladophialophora bantiana CBS 173.52]KIW97426.1 potassium/sodium efflux P-type ATPase, fungal-type [Cladophialophora bantiana CBS 173.52]